LTQVKEIREVFFRLCKAEKSSIINYKLLHFVIGEESMETFTVEELAKYLKLHTFTVRRLAREGKIPSFKAGGQWRFDKFEIQKWAQKGIEK